MGFGRIGLILVLSWLLLGVLSVAIAQCSRRLQQKLIHRSRGSIHRAVEIFARQRGYSELQVRHYFGIRDTDNTRLGWCYLALVIFGPYAYWFLWRTSLLKIPRDNPD